MPVEIRMPIYNIFNIIITKAANINYNEIIKNNNCPFEILPMINICVNSKTITYTCLSQNFNFNLSEASVYTSIQLLHEFQQQIME